jgi:hypothetical protein
VPSTGAVLINREGTPPSSSSASTTSGHSSLPPELATSGGRQQWFKVARRWLDDERAEQAAPIPRDRPKRVREAKRRLDEQLFTEMRAEQAYQRYRARGRDRRGGRLGPNTVPKPYIAPEMPPGEINLTDPDSRMVKGQHQFIQGYNAQAATNEHQIVIGAEIEVVSPDFGHLERTLNAARRELQAAGVTELPKLVVADSGYWHTEQMQRLAAEGIPVLIPPDSGLRTGPRPGWTGGIYDFMRRVLASEHGKALYHQRQHLIESLFGSIKHNRGFRQFLRRGRAAVRTEWRLITATHNLRKLHQHQIAIAAGGRPPRAAARPAGPQPTPAGPESRSRLTRQPPTKRTVGGDGSSQDVGAWSQLVTWPAYWGSWSVMSNHGALKATMMCAVGRSAGASRSDPSATWT